MTCFGLRQKSGAGLDYAHRNGFVHRDVKPENILFADGHALLADFGIAHVCTDKNNDPLTKGGIALGTPEYMSPEQASGSDDIGTATDIYALGCVMYEMLSGSPPFRGNSSLAVMARHVTEKPRPIRAIRPETPPHVEHALARALSKLPEQRFALRVGIRRCAAAAAKRRCSTRSDGDAQHRSASIRECESRPRQRIPERRNHRRADRCAGECRRTSRCVAHFCVCLEGKAAGRASDWCTARRFRSSRRHACAARARISASPRSSHRLRTVRSCGRIATIDGSTMSSQFRMRWRGRS